MGGYIYMKFICYNYLPLLADYVFDLPINNYLNVGITPLHNYPTLNNISQLKSTDVNNTNSEVGIKTLDNELP